MTISPDATSPTPARPHVRPLGRRTVLATGTVGAGVTGLIGLGALPAAEAVERSSSGSPFQHGVASGDPLPRACVIWTRVTPTRTSLPGSGKGPKVSVAWEVSKDPRFKKVVRKGRFQTGSSRDHTVKVDVTRLKPATWYYYRFTLQGVRSDVGRLRTAPARKSLPENLRLGVVSCANLQAGWFSAYRGLAARDDLHAILHLGDYLYEYAPGGYGYGQSNEDIRPHEPAHEMVSLADYRQRHAQYKRDADLQALHAKYAWIVTWDDHEVTNDQWKDGAENHEPDEGDYLARRARSHRAYDEWMPVRLNGTAALGDGSRLYRRLQFGRLAELSMLDLRTYRSEQVDATSPPPVPTPDGEVSDPSRTILGRQQLRWLKKSLVSKKAQWKLIGNPVMIAPVTFGSLPERLVGQINDVTGLLPEDGLPYNVDQWDGYTHDRHQVFDQIRNHQVKDALFITGDIHSGWACELPYDTSIYPVGDSAGVEFVCSSVTSNNLKDITGDPSGVTSTLVEEGIKANNRHIKYLDFDSHGFSVLDLNADRAQMDWFVIGERADKNTTITWSTSWMTESGTGRITPVDSPVGA